jgi:hypothetical protein
LTQFVTSVTERGAFRDCRRRWHLESVERLAPRTQVAFALEFGTCIHTGLEYYYRSGRNETDMLDGFEAAWHEVDDRLARDFEGLYKMGVEGEWWEYKLLGDGMLQNYHLFDTRERWFDEVIEVNLEERSFIPILDPAGRRSVARGGAPLLSGRVDLVVRKGEDAWIWDHKTAAQKPSYRALDVDDQGTGYCYIVYRTLGVIPRGFMYNVLLKRVPKDPRILSTGRLSQDKSLLMTYDHYLKCIKANGDDPADYAEHLEELKNRGYDDFFVRDTSFRNLANLEMFEKRLYYEYKDMVEVIRKPHLAYPNPNQRNCPSCSMLPICQAMEEQGHADYIRDNQYLVTEPRYEIPMHLRPKRERTKVGSSDTT